MSLEMHGFVGRGHFSRSVNLIAHAGEIVVVTGTNGSGKSTVIHTIAGLVPLLEGSLVVDNITWDAPALNMWVPCEERMCAVVFQDLRLFPHLSALRNVAFGLRARGVPRADALARAQEMITIVGAQSFQDRRPSHLSGGERQRVALARALVLNPKVLLLDEPFASVDEDSHQSFRDILPEAVQRSGAITVMVTHDTADAEAMGTHHLAM